MLREGRKGREEIYREEGRINMREAGRIKRREPCIELKNYLVKCACSSCSIDGIHWTQN